MKKRATIIRTPLLSCFTKRKKKKGKNFDRKLIFLFILPPPLKKTAASSSHKRRTCAAAVKKEEEEERTPICSNTHTHHRNEAETARRFRRGGGGGEEEKKKEEEKECKHKNTTGCVTSVVRVSVPVHPSKLANRKKGVREQLDAKTLRHHDGFGGVLVKYEELSIVNEDENGGDYFTGLVVRERESDGESDRVCAENALVFNRESEQNRPGPYRFSRREYLQRVDSNRKV